MSLHIEFFQENCKVGFDPKTLSSPVLPLSPLFSIPVNLGKLKMMKGHGGWCAAACGVHEELDTTVTEQQAQPSFLLVLVETLWHHPP